MMYIALPKTIDSKYLKQMKENEQKLVYARDVHYFFKSLVLGPEYEHFEDGLLGDLRKDRTCKDIPSFKETIMTTCACSWIELIRREEGYIVIFPVKYFLCSQEVWQ